MRERIETYISHLSVNRRLSDASIKAYLRDLGIYSDFLGTEDIGWNTVDMRTARNFLSSLSARGFSNTGINRTLSAVRGFYRYWVKEGEIEVNPFDTIQGLKKRNRLPKTIFSTEMDALFASIPESGFTGTRDRLLFELLYSTGCRVSEAVGINPGDFSSDRKSLKVMGKGSKERFVFMGSFARKALEDYLPYRNAVLKKAGAGTDSKALSSCPLFLNSRGGRLTVRGVSHILDGYSRKAGLPGRISPHTFRHTFATDLLNNGANIREVQEMLGHSSLSTTTVYTHVGIENTRRVYRKAHPHGGGKT